MQKGGAKKSLFGARGERGEKDLPCQGGKGKVGRCNTSQKKGSITLLTGLREGKVLYDRSHETKGPFLKKIIGLFRKKLSSW